MQRVATYGFADVLPSADVDSIQDNAAGIAQIPYTLVGAPYMYCDTSPTIKIGGIRALLLPGFPNNNLGDGSEITFNATTGGALAADTWYYVYATSSGGVISIGKTTTAPDSDLARVGANNQRYLGCFKTRVAAATILSFRMVRGKYIYQTSDHSLGEFDALNPGTATAYTAVGLASWVPPHSRLATIRATLVSDATLRTLYFRTDIDANDSHHYIRHALDNTQEPAETFDFILNSSQQIYYKVSNAAATAIIRVSGFYE